MDNKFENQFTDINQLLRYGDYSQLTKRIIDLTLDTENTNFYRETITLLAWLDENEENEKEKIKCFEEILHKLGEELRNKPISDELKTLITTNNLTKTYKKSPFSLGPISIELKEGEIIGLAGENGNGKTTLLRTLCGELKATSGTVFYNFPYSSNYDLRANLIYIPQRTDSWSGSLLSNLRLAASCYGIKGETNELMVELIVARMGLRKYRLHRWKDLSSGYKMRFELARALLRKPKILLIDEPLANLDILAQQVILDDFKDIAQSPFRPLGIILSSQQLYEVEKTSNSVIFLREGAQQNQTQTTEGETEATNKLIVEFETSLKQDELRQILSVLQLEQLQINGGTYVAYFPTGRHIHHFMKTVLDNNIPITYIRDISKSTRRFFLS